MTFGRTDSAQYTMIMDRKVVTEVTHIKILYALQHEGCFPSTARYR